MSKRVAGHGGRARALDIQGHGRGHGLRTQKSLHPTLRWGDSFRCHLKKAASSQGAKGKRLLTGRSAVRAWTAAHVAGMPGFEGAQRPPRTARMQPQPPSSAYEGLAPAAWQKHRQPRVCTDPHPGYGEHGEVLPSGLLITGYSQRTTGCRTHGREAQLQRPPPHLGSGQSKWVWRKARDTQPAPPSQGRLVGRDLHGGLSR